MVPWWKRIVYSIMSVLVADCVATLVVLGTDIASHPEHARGLTSGQGMLGVLLVFCFVVYFSVPGWLLASPFVLVLRRLEGWRTWVCAIVGTFIGPGLMYALALYAVLRRPGLLKFPTHIDMNATVVSIVATALYISLMTRRRRAVAPLAIETPAAH